MYFEISGSIQEIETVAKGPGVRARKWLNQRYGRHYWRKMKGVATVKLKGGRMRLAEFTGMKLTEPERRNLK